jgi:hypothetical protein
MLPTGAEAGEGLAACTSHLRCQSAQRCAQPAQVPADHLPASRPKRLRITPLHRYFFMAGYRKRLIRYTKERGRQTQTQGPTPNQPQQLPESSSGSPP